MTDKIILYIIFHSFFKRSERVAVSLILKLLHIRFGEVLILIAYVFGCIYKYNIWLFVERSKCCFRKIQKCACFTSSKIVDSVLDVMRISKVQHIDDILYIDEIA